MAAVERLDRGINKNDGRSGLHKEPLGDRSQSLRRGTLRRSGNESPPPEDVCEFELDQGPTPDGLPGLSDSDRKRRPRSNLASEFWSQGYAKLRTLDTRSHSNERVDDPTALVKEPAEPLLHIDTAEPARTHSRDQSSRSSKLSFPELDSISAIPSGVDRPARQVPRSSVRVFGEVPEHGNEPLYTSSRGPTGLPTPVVPGRDQSLEVEAQNCCSPIPANISNIPAKSRGGYESDSLIDPDVAPLHTEHVKSTIPSHREIENNIFQDSLPKRSVTGKPKPAISTSLILGNEASFHPSQGLKLFFPKQRPNLDISSESIFVPRSNGLSSGRASSRFFEARPVIPITPTKNPNIRHPKSFSAEAAALRPSPPPNASTGPRSFRDKDRGTSLSIGTGHYSPSYVSVIPNTPLRHRSLGHSRQNNMGMPSIHMESGVFQNPGASSRFLIATHYPEPHQYNLEGQGQVFDNQGSMSSPMPAHFRDASGPNIYPFPPSMHCFDNNTFHQNAQVYQQGEQNAEYPQSDHFDSYATSHAANPTPNAADLHQNGNMYTQDTNGYGPRYYSNHTDPAHQVPTACFT